MLLSLKNLEKHFRYCSLGRDCYESRLRAASKSFVVIPGTIRDGRARISGPINHNYVNSGPGTAWRACHSRALKAPVSAYVCVRKSRMREDAREKCARAETQTDNLPCAIKIHTTAHPGPGDESILSLSLLSSRSQRID